MVQSARSYPDPRNGASDSDLLIRHFSATAPDLVPYLVRMRDRETWSSEGEEASHILNLFAKSFSDPGDPPSDIRIHFAKAPLAAKALQVQYEPKAGTTDICSAALIINAKNAPSDLRGTLFWLTRVIQLALLRACSCTVELIPPPRAAST